MKRTLLDFIEKQKPAKVSPGILLDQEASTSSNEQSLASSVTSSGSAIDRHRWVRDIHQEEGIEVFVLHTDGGTLCLLCKKHTIRSYSHQPAYSTKPNKLKAHLISDMHKLAVEMDQQMRQSTFHALHKYRVEHNTITIAQRIQHIYWVLKEEIALRKVASLQSLVNKIGLNDRLSDFQHTSSTSVSEFVAMISQHLTDKTLNSLKKAAFWASMVDKTTDIATLQQYITFVRYVEESEIKMSFLDIRRIDANDATADKLYKYWQDVADIYGLDQEKQIAMSVDGSAQCSAKTTHLHNESSLTTRYAISALLCTSSCTQLCRYLQGFGGYPDL